MKIYTYVATLIIGFLFGFYNYTFAAEYPFSGEDLAKLMVDADRGQTSHQIGKTILYNFKNGEWKIRQERDTEMYFRRNGKTDEQKIEFLSPSDVRGVTFLTKDQEGTENDETYTYMPALKKAFRIKGNNQFREFTNTDFKSLDLQKFNPDEFSFNITGKEKIQGHECYILESIVKSTSDEQYDKIMFWIMSDSYLVLKAQFYHASEKKDGFFKELRIEKLEKISDIWTPMHTIMENFVKKSKTEIQTITVEYNSPLDPGIFSKNSFYR